MKAVKKLFDRAFFKGLLGFVIILAVGFSILVAAGAYDDFTSELASVIKSAFVQNVR